jgi:hypothetical protein
MLASAVVYRYLVSESYPEYQSNLEAKELSRVIQALEPETNHIDQFLRDYSSWDESHQFLADRNESYVQNNFPILRENQIHLSAIFDLSVETVMISFRDYAENTDS